MLFFSKSKWGAGWRNHLPKKFGFTSIKTLIDWSIDEGNRLFAGTRHANTWVFYHDALSQWWEKGEGGAQEYLASRGFADRQWRARGETNDKIDKNYRNKLMGDSPELMPLDSSLFGDLIEKVAMLVVSTGRMEGEDRYTMGTPDEAWRAMVEAWSLVPEERILEDIGRFKSALEAIVAAKGAYVKDCDLRNGHRKAMQEIVRGGALRGRRGAQAGEQAAAAAKVEAGIQAAVLTWEGISSKIGAST